MSNAPASIYKTQKTCPLCSEKAEFELPQDFHCPRCGRRKSLFLQAFDSHSSGVIHDKVVYLEDQVRVWKESYEELERLAREQVAKLERSANTAWEQVRLADNNLILATNALRSIQSHAIGSAYILMVCNDALRKIEGDRHHPAPAVPEAFYRAAFNAGIEAAAKVCEKFDSMRWSGAPEEIRKLEMKP